jgi:predicted RNase H-like HicB family nuclease
LKNFPQISLLAYNVRRHRHRLKPCGYKIPNLLKQVFNANYQHSVVICDELFAFQPTHHGGQPEITVMTTKTLGYYFKLPYVIELIPDEDGYWFASIPLLKGCMTQGESREEALVMLDEAKELWLTTALEESITIPEPQPVSSV